MAQGAALQVDPIPVVITSAQATTIADAAVIAANDTRFRLLGGNHASELFGGVQFLGPQAISQTAPATPRDVFTVDRYGLNTGFEFVLPAGQTTFEFVSTDGGNHSLLTLRVNGKATTALGYDLSLAGLGNFRYVRFELPPSATNRLITVGTPSMAFGGLRLPAGETIGPRPDTTNYATVVFAGDSITEGTGASSWLRAWYSIASVRLGFQNPITTGVGGTGYIATRSGLSMPDRVLDVLRAVNGNPPDMVVVAAGINDCGGYPHAQTAAAALDYFRALRSGAPNMPIVVLGPFNGPNDSYPQILADCRDAIFASARQVSGTYTVDVGDWVTAANKDVVFGAGAPNGPHPTDAGHEIYGARAADAIRPIILTLP